MNAKTPSRRAWWTCCRWGEEARVTLDVGDAAGGTLGFSMPLHAALRNGLAAGEDCTVSLLREAIHIMSAGCR
ncbi:MULTISPECIES: hypothetical protein [Roseomonadaceae]|uniref:Uncharacterized protein n=1 Tax=Falsiroseomonas oleicola TaxID=2801474 RepID=A0ABS6H9B5_9PROT|nr:hypothetical protein [Roseomonas oleicola]MBU8544298.1 hypothetical protein [Roseomonas oleicola]